MQNRIANNRSWSPGGNTSVVIDQCINHEALTSNHFRSDCRSTSESEGRRELAAAIEKLHQCGVAATVWNCVVSTQSMYPYGSIGAPPSLASPVDIFTAKQMTVKMLAHLMNWQSHRRVILELLDLQSLDLTIYIFCSAVGSRNFKNSQGRNNPSALLTGRRGVADGAACLAKAGRHAGSRHGLTARQGLVARRGLTARQGQLV